MTDTRPLECTAGYSGPATLIAGEHEASVTDWLRQHALLACGAAYWAPEDVERAAAVKLNPASLDALCTVPCPANLAELQLARLRMGHLRYGAGGRNHYDAIGSCLQRLSDYRAHGNREHLVDIANLIAIEWLWPNRATAWYSTAKWPWPSPEAYCRLGCARLSLENYTRPFDGCRSWLVDALDRVREEWLSPSVAGAHWAPQDCGGHWSLRNEGVRP